MYGTGLLAIKSVSVALTDENGTLTFYNAVV